MQEPTDGLTAANFTKIDPSKILILQVDNRDLTPYLQTGNQAVNFSSLPFYANSVLANVLYAQRYGYQYERLEAIVPQDVQYRHITWWCVFLLDCQTSALMIATGKCQLSETR